MTTQRITTQRKYGLRDFAVDGLWRGALAGLAMAAYLIAAAVARGDAPLSDLSRFTSYGVEAAPLVGCLSHLAVSAIYGAVFTVLWKLLVRRASSGPLALIGALVYSGLLFTAAELVLLPAIQSPLLAIPALPFGIAHTVYGLVLGALTMRSQQV